MKLDKSILEGVVPVVIDRKRLSHPNQPSHINGGDDVRMFNGSCERDSGSPKVFLVFQRCPSTAPAEEATPCLNNNCYSRGCPCC